jgi:hypothetical protein
MNTQPRPASDWLSRLVLGVALCALGWLVLCEATRPAPPTFRRPGPSDPIPTPIARGDACPEPLCHSGPFDPMTGHPRPGGYKTVQQIDAEAR